ncbi:DUF721 domain-containing protein [Chachezhania antarctica]|uniref:DUF721 domain-containing protein n=1 Tax=Chachezhania antarctica TaxID=2340860 RepID=UPI000EAC6555|nr:DciA family protein [Chachezhania antarctica]|tara:strand:+ start:2319 stop:2843 length:525 start_codon:yes stop_codon:yes gene_type:complete
MAPRPSSTRGFKRTASILDTKIRKAGESRGFAVSRVLTHWEEIAGPEIAKMAKPVKVNYGRASFGATLTVLTTGSMAPMLEMQKDRLRERVNAAYGYNAISKVLITQTAPTGFADGQHPFAARPPDETEPDTKHVEASAARAAEGVADEGLRAALERLGRGVLSKTGQKERGQT